MKAATEVPRALSLPDSGSLRGRQHRGRGVGRPDGRPSGMAEITSFDLTGHPVRFAAEVKNFDPHKFVEKKEARKMGRFIHFALAASARGHGALRPERHARHR